MDGYTAEDKKWIRQCTEMEMKSRHKWTDKWIEHEREVRLKVVETRSAERIHQQKVAGVALILGVAGGIGLIYVGKTEAGLALVGVVFSVPTAAGLLRKFQVWLEKVNKPNE